MKNYLLYKIQDKNDDNRFINWLLKNIEEYNSNKANTNIINLLDDMLGIYISNQNDTEKIKYICKKLRGFINQKNCYIYYNKHKIKNVSYINEYILKVHFHNLSCNDKYLIIPLISMYDNLNFICEENRNEKQNSNK